MNSQSLAPLHQNRLNHRTKILILANPTSGGYNANIIAKITTRLEAAGHEVDLHLTQRAGEIGELCSNLSTEVDTLVIAGGDGSINEAITGFQDKAVTTKLAVIPFGTANVLALELGLPKRVGAIADVILKQKTAPLHYGFVNGRPFILMASAGFDAEVVHERPARSQKAFWQIGLHSNSFPALLLT